MSDAIKLERTKTPGIYKRGGRYVAVYRDNTGKQRKAFGRTVKEARAKRDAERTDIERGEFRTTSKEPLEEYGRRWIKTYGGRTEKGIRSHTRDDYEHDLESDIYPFLGRLPIGQIEAKHLRELAERIRGRGVSAQTVRKKLAPLKA